MNQKIIDIYTFLQRKVDKSFRFPKGNSGDWVSRCIEDLTKREGSLALPVVVDYCIQQVFAYKDRQDERFNVSWAFSKNAVDKFYSSKRGIRFYQDTWLKDFDLSREKLLGLFTVVDKHIYDKEIYLEYEDTLKARFPATNARLIFCLSQTTLFTPKSPVCSECMFMNKCREVLRKRNPELFRLRTKNNNDEYK